jgi:hypothetical protein
MATKSPDRAYLIRCWQEGDAAELRWRFSAEEVLHERRRRGFADWASLLEYLRAEFPRSSSSRTSNSSAELGSAGEGGSSLTNEDEPNGEGHADRPSGERR